MRAKDVVINLGQKEKERRKHNLNLKDKLPLVHLNEKLEKDPKIIKH